MSNIVEVATSIFHAIKPDSEIVVDYDRKVDVLYINFHSSPLQKADFGRRFGDYIVRIKQGLVIGVTVINASFHLKRSFSDKPSILTEPVTVKIS